MIKDTKFHVEWSPLLLQQLIYSNKLKAVCLKCKNTMCQYFRIHWKNYFWKMKCGKCFCLEWKYFPTDGLVCLHVCTCNFCLIRSTMLWEPLLFSWSCDFFQQTSVNKLQTCSHQQIAVCVFQDNCSIRRKCQ